MGEQVTTRDRTLQSEGLPPHGDTRRTLSVVETSVPGTGRMTTIFAAAGFVTERFCGSCLVWIETASTSNNCPECGATFTGGMNNGR